MALLRRVLGVVDLDRDRRALIGVLAVFWLQCRADAKAFGQYPGTYCTTAEGRRFCAFWIDQPTQTGE